MFAFCISEDYKKYCPRMLLRYRYVDFANFGNLLTIRKNRATAFKFFCVLAWSQSISALVKKWCAHAHPEKPRSRSPFCKIFRSRSWLKSAAHFFGSPKVKESWIFWEIFNQLSFYLSILKGFMYLLTKSSNQSFFARNVWKYMLCLHKNQ